MAAILGDHQGKRMHDQMDPDTKGLLDSNFGDSVQILEENITAYLILTSQTNLNSLRDRAINLTRCENNIETSNEIAKLICRINELGQYFFFVDAENAQKVKKLILETGEFPQCAAHFETLRVQMTDTKGSFDELCKLRGEIQAKQTAIHRERAAQLQPRVIPLSPARQSFVKNMAETLWKTGINLFKQVLTNHPMERDPEVSLDQFVSGVFDHHFADIENIGDIQDFMNLIIAKLPENEFEELEKGLTERGSHPELVVERAVNQYLASQIQGPITLDSLKRWLLSCS